MSVSDPLRMYSFVFFVNSDRTPNIHVYLQYIDIVRTLFRQKICDKAFQQNKKCNDKQR